MKRYIQTFFVINDQLQNISQIEHTRHRSVINCMVNILCGSVAYTFQEKKPSLKFNTGLFGLNLRCQALAL